MFAIIYGPVNLPQVRNHCYKTILLYFKNTFF